jgi:GxxExxY protein
MRDNELTGTIIGLAMRVHNALGPGLLESAYKESLFYEIQKAGLRVEKEKPMPLIYEEVKLECGYRIDLLIKDRLVIETKSVEALNDIHLAQILTYLKLGNYKLGLLINFNVVHLRNGLKRVANNFSDPSAQSSASSAVSAFKIEG